VQGYPLELALESPRSQHKDQGQGQLDGLLCKMKDKMIGFCGSRKNNQCIYV
jgi:hypothetical protein